MTKKPVPPASPAPAPSPRAVCDHQLRHEHERQREADRLNEVSEDQSHNEGSSQRQVGS